MRRVEVNYVVGLIFDVNGERILLIKKNKPEDLRGKLNGIGGKIEPNESVKAAIIREVVEEAGWRIPPANWEYFLKLSAYYKEEIRNLYFFRTFQVLANKLYEQRTAEELVVIPTANLWAQPVVNNLRWIIPLALDTGIVVPVSMEDFNV